MLPGITESPSLHWSAAGARPVAEQLAAEAPLAIEIAYRRGEQAVRRLLAVTMRTPGSDEELALGFLHGEGLIRRLDEVAGGRAADQTVRGETLPTWIVELAQPPREALERVSRSLLTSSACGFCGRPSLEGLPVGSVAADGQLRWDPALLPCLPEQLRQRQPLFLATGGSHGAGLATAAGAIDLIREDVGRHNAVDKLIGAALLAGLPLAERALVLSGRASFELLQKASAAGIGLVIAVGAPSSLAVDLAHQSGITLIGFARDRRFNVYTHAGRIRT
jgi:FdhD protein